jgi:hypothetical protein
MTERKKEKNACRKGEKINKGRKIKRRNKTKGKEREKREIK